MELTVDQESTQSGLSVGTVNLNSPLQASFPPRLRASDASIKSPPIIGSRWIQDLHLPPVFAPRDPEVGRFSNNGSYELVSNTSNESFCSGQRALFALIRETCIGSSSSSTIATPILQRTGIVIREDGKVGLLIARGDGHFMNPAAFEEMARKILLYKESGRSEINCSELEPNRTVRMVESSLDNPLIKRKSFFSLLIGNFNRASDGALRVFNDAFSSDAHRAYLFTKHVQGAVTPCATWTSNTDFQDVSISSLFDFVVPGFGAISIFKNQHRDGIATIGGIVLDREGVVSLFYLNELQYNGDPSRLNIVMNVVAIKWGRQGLDALLRDLNSGDSSEREVLGLNKGLNLEASKIIFHEDAKDLSSLDSNYWRVRLIDKLNNNCSAEERRTFLEAFLRATETIG